MQTHIPALAHRSEIDGLRAVAVTAVILHHVSEKMVPGGFLGVDIFFVISGFLITGIVLRDLRRNGFNPLAFYERRCRRILPPLVIMTLATAILSFFYFIPPDYGDFGASMTATATFWANAHFYRTTGYFAAEAMTKPLLHTWSLSIEEQFYIVFPALLLILHARMRRFAPSLLALLCLLSLADNYVTGSRNAEAAFYHVWSRAWELLLGALIAFYPQRFAPTGALSTLLSFAGLAGIFWSIFAFNPEIHAGYRATLLPCLGTAAFILAHTNGFGQSPGGRALASSVPVGLGKLSYSLYLWHWPLLAMTRYEQGGSASPAAVTAALALALLLSYLSWRFVENPVRSRSFPAKRSSLFALSLLSVILLAGAGAAIRHWDGFAGRLPAPARFYAAAMSDKTRRPWRRSTRAAVKNGVSYEFEVFELDAADKPTRFMVLGDSHAVMWLRALDAFSEEYGVGGVLLDSVASNALVMRESIGNDAAWRHGDYQDALLEYATLRGVRHMLIACRYTGRFGLPVLATETKSATGWEMELRENLEKIVAACRRRSITVWFLENVPEYLEPVPRMLVRNSLKGFSAMSQGYDAVFYENRNAPGNMVLDALASPDFHPLEVKNHICPEGWCAPGDENGAYYFDTNHLTGYGALRFKEALRPMFEAMAEK